MKKPPEYYSEVLASKVLHLSKHSIQIACPSPFSTSLRFFTCDLGLLQNEHLGSTVLKLIIFAVILLASMHGFEPRLGVLETLVLPLTLHRGIPLWYLSFFPCSETRLFFTIVFSVCFYWI